MQPRTIPVLRQCRLPKATEEGRRVGRASHGQAASSGSRGDRVLRVRFDPGSYLCLGLASCIDGAAHDVLRDAKGHRKRGNRDAGNGSNCITYQVRKITKESHCLSLCPTTRAVNCDVCVVQSASLGRLLDVKLLGCVGGP